MSSGDGYWNSLSSKWQNSPIQDGLYLLNVKVEGKPMVKGWFTLSKTTSTALPVIEIPLPGQFIILAADFSLGGFPLS